MMEQQPHADLKDKARDELRTFVMITVYLTLFLGAFNTYRRLILEEYGIAYLHYGITLIEALILAKIIMIGDAMKLGRSLERSSLFQGAVVKSILFAGLVWLFTVLERVVDGLIHGMDWASIGHEIVHYGPYEIFARMIMMIVAFLPFFAFWELRRVLGPRKFSALWFSKAESSARGNTSF